jgi:Tol biopolymer transport system component
LMTTPTPTRAVTGGLVVRSGFRVPVRVCWPGMITGILNAKRTGVKPALRQITDYPGKEYSPDWSPGGHSIVFYQDTRTKGLRIFTIRPDGTGRHLVVQDGRDPVWSPDGRKIAFTRDDHVYTMNPDGTSERQVPGTPQESGPSETLPDWGPKGP